MYSVCEWLGTLAPLKTCKCRANNCETCKLLHDCTNVMCFRNYCYNYIFVLLNLKTCQILWLDSAIFFQSSTIAIKMCFERIVWIDVVCSLPQICMSIHWYENTLCVYSVTGETFQRQVGLIRPIIKL